jgi:hypothetical protein
LFGPRFEPVEAAALYGCGPVAEGLPQKCFFERLADQRGADDVAVPVHQAAVGLVGKEDLGGAGDRERIDHAGERGEQGEQQQRGAEQAAQRAVGNRSIGVGHEEILAINRRRARRAADRSA